MKDLKKVQEFFSKPMGEGYYEFDMEDEGPDYNSISSLEDELRRLIRFSNQSGSKGADAKIEQLKQRIAQLKNQINEEQEDPTDIIAMDVPLFLRMLEYAREDAEQDIDLHKVTERAIEAVKLRGLLSMEDYQDIVGEPIDEMTGYSKYLTTPENPKGKTQGLTQDVMDKILLKIATMGDDDVEETTRLGEGVIYEELCPKGKAYITKRKAAGEKSSAYLSGRAVKVCKGQMKG
jgi:ribosomal protein L29